jgi:hypothetical protein
MRMQLKRCAAGACAAALIALTPRAGAQLGVAVDGRTSLYQDSDRTTISTTTAAVKISPIEQISVKGRYLADIITSASIDVVSSATKKPFHETRHEGMGSVSYQDGTRTAKLGYIYSVENDFRSHTVTASYANDFLSHRLTVGLGGGFTTSDVGRAKDLSFHRDLKQGDASIDVGIVASKNDLVTFDYTLIYLTGYQASPYRFAYWKSPAFTALPSSAPETDPERRVRSAFAVRWNHHAFKDTAIKSHLRGYADDWGVLSITGGAEYVVGFNLGQGSSGSPGDFEFAVFVRGYAQRNATFYESVYDKLKVYMTADRELSSFLDAFGGLRLGWARRVSVFDELRAELKGTGFAFHFFDFPRLTSRTGFIAELALGGTI